MLLAAFLLIWTPPAASLQDAPTRAEILSGSREFLAGVDADGDGALSLAEWTGVTSEPRSAREASAHAELRAYLIGQHGRMDGNRDGKVTFDELVREPLANFDCADGNRDRRLSQMEIESGRKSCPSGPAIRIGFIAAPPAEAAPDQ